MCVICLLLLMSIFSLPPSCLPFPLPCTELPHVHPRETFQFILAALREHPGWFSFLFLPTPLLYSNISAFGCAHPSQISLTQRQTRAATGQNQPPALTCSQQVPWAISCLLLPSYPTLTWLVPDLLWKVELQKEMSFLPHWFWPE